ncbi:UNVERIFIED_CONTAM: hypothetical protein PYX00_000439 [Menopon gallinae]
MMNGMSGVRLRMGRNEDVSSRDGVSRRKSNKSTNLPQVTAPGTTPLYYAFILFAVYAIMFWIQGSMDSFQYPTVRRLADIENYPDDFIAERAMERLVKLTDIGPRVAGSYENEVLAVKVLTEEIRKIMKEANLKKHKIELEVKKYSGSFPLRFLDGLTNVYRDVQNVIVKLSPQSGSRHSLLLNCHFDSVPDSPGGSDDGAGCAVMLEILYMLSKSKTPLKNNVVFLFNGAEENLLHGSHGFITQHRWAKEVRAFINLEACGAGGREVLFQSGPQSPWIMKLYAENVRYPFASSLAQEVFESGIIPGDTDFRVFRDFGNISGLDFAWSTNGYVYHTKFDNVDQIPLETLQRTGENILGLTRGMANAQELSDVARFRPGNMIYFDVLGLYLVRWPEMFGNFINIITTILSFWVLRLDLIDAEKEGIRPKLYLETAGKVLGVIVFSSLCSTLATLCISGFISLIGRSMSWYSKPMWLVFLYIIPTVTTVMVFQHYFSGKFLKTIKSRMVLFHIYFNVYQFFWTCILLVLTMLKIRSGYIAWMWVVSPVAVKLVLRAVRKPLPKNPNLKWLLFVLSSVFTPAIQYINMLVGFFSLFIPIMGRSGTQINSEIVTALFTNITCGLLFSYVIPIITVIENPKKIFSIMGIVFPSALLLLLFTPLGFPYSGDTYAPRPQRYMLLHTQRTFHNRHGVEIGSESGYWIVDHDCNSPHTAAPFVPELNYAKQMDKDCEKHLYCGFPYLMPVLSFIRKTHWIVTSPPKIDVDTTMKVVSRARLGDDIVRVTLDISGPDHMGLILSPKPGVQFDQWSLNDDQPVRGPLWNGQETYFVYYASSSGSKNWEIFVDFKIQNGNFNETIMDVAVISHYLHGPKKNDIGFKRMLAQFPPWTAVNSWTATYKSYIV